MTLQQARTLAMALPSVTEEPHFDYTSFRIHGKIIATAPPDEEYLHVFVSEPEREAALALAPDALEELHWGKRVVGLRVCLVNARISLVKQLLEQAFAGKAAKRGGKRKSPN